VVAVVEVLELLVELEVSLEVDDELDVLLELVAVVCVGVVSASFEVASNRPPIPAVATIAIEPIDTIIFVALFTCSPNLSSIAIDYGSYHYSSYYCRRGMCHGRSSQFDDRAGSPGSTR
jgi:hypothetical protein